MKRDIRETDLYREAEGIYRTLRQPGTGRITDAAEVHVSPDGRHAVFAGMLADSLQGVAPTRICTMDLACAETRVLTFGPNSDRLPKFSPDGRQIAFLSDRHRGGDSQLHLLDVVSGVARAAPAVQGWVEYLHWSPDGGRVLLGVAGHGADIAGRQGAMTSQQVGPDVPSWVPSVEIGNESYRWRSVWVYEVSRDRVQRITDAMSNIWEAVWCGNEALAAVMSPGPGEGLWYSAGLYVIPLDTGTCRQVYRPKDQLGWVAVTPSGTRLAVVEAACSDRLSVTGDLLLIDVTDGTVRRVDTRGVDITHTEWRTDRHLLLAGQRGLEMVVSLYQATSDEFTELWVSSDVSTGEHVRVSGLGAEGDCVLVSESFLRPPEIAVIRQGEYRAVKSFDVADSMASIRTQGVERIAWHAPDGLEIQGWLLRPTSNGPHPLIMNVHGGPVSLWRPSWLGRRSAQLLMLLERGYALFFPNPRGSAGRGQAFARRVMGDMGGADTHDYLSGLDYLVAQGIADPKRLGVTGTSYGGFMTAWLITQTERFAAAVAVAPFTNCVSEHLISNIGQWVKLFLADAYTNANGKYFHRSPIMHACKVKTPTLNICGALDRCTPPEEAAQFHSALLENGVKSVLVIYPEEGHGVRKWPAVIDYSARVVSWFQEHMPLTAGAGKIGEAQQVANGPPSCGERE